MAVGWLPRVHAGILSAQRQHDDDAYSVHFEYILSILIDCCRLYISFVVHLRGAEYDRFPMFVVDVKPADILRMYICVFSGRG